MTLDGNTLKVCSEDIETRTFRRISFKRRKDFLVETYLNLSHQDKGEIGEK